MSLTRLPLRPKLSDEEVRRLKGERPSDQHFDTLIAQDVDAYDVEAGRLVCRFRKGVLPAAAVRVAREVFGDIDERLQPSWSRMSAAGRLQLDRVQALRPDVIAVHPDAENPFEGQLELRSGIRLQSNVSNPVRSYLAGYNYDRYRKQGHLAGFSEAFPRDWERAVQFFEAIGDSLDHHMPNQAHVMHRWCKAHSVKPAFTIGRACLSTVAVNVNYDSAFHYDRGDIRDGYSTLTAISVGGSYAGGFLVLPRYRVAIDVGEGDVLFNQSHVDLHGNTPVHPETPGAKRVSFVTYLKEMLRHAVNKENKP